MKYVSGSPVTPHARWVSLPGSRTWGNVSPNWVMKSRASSRASCASSPTNSTSPGGCAFQARSSTFASARHGSHQEAQKLSTSGVPRSSRRDTEPSAAARDQAPPAREPSASAESVKPGAGTASPRESASSIVELVALVVSP